MIGGKWVGGAAVKGARHFKIATFTFCAGKKWKSIPIFISSILQNIKKLRLRGFGLAMRICMRPFSCRWRFVRRGRSKPLWRRLLSLLYKRQTAAIPNDNYLGIAVNCSIRVTRRCTFSFLASCLLWLQIAMFAWWMRWLWSFDRYRNLWRCYWRAEMNLDSNLLRHPRWSEQRQRSIDVQGLWLMFFKWTRWSCASSIGF